VVVFFYGGGWKTGKREQYRFVGQRLSQQGVLAIVTDYRTFPRSTFPGFVEDGARAVAWSRGHAAEYGGDPRRLFVGGHSAGAQIAALLGTDARYLATQGMKPRDLSGVIGLSGPYDFVIEGGYEEVFGPKARWREAQAGLAGASSN
jgi:acetyl esterase/lipase